MQTSKRNWKLTIINIVAMAAVFTIVQLIISGGLITTYYQINLFMICINIILAVSLNLINGFTGQFSLGHAGFMSVGAYVSVIFTTLAGPFPFWLALLLGSLAAGFMGLLIGIPTLRLRGDYLAIATLGLGEIIKVVLNNIDYVGGAAGVSDIPPLTTWPIMFIATIATVVIIQNFINSSYGRACISVREDEVAAELMGVDITRYKIIAFTMGAFFAGLAGGLYAHYFYVIRPDIFSFLKSFDILVIVVLGGLGSTSGAVIAAIFLTIISAALQSFPEIRMILYSLVLIVVMIYRPQGLMGNKELSAVMLKRKRGDDRGAAGN
ncbi:MAG: branched-chain amino acid ABC transporter permease [Methylocystaceae bacterium]